MDALPSNSLLRKLLEDVLGNQEGESRCQGRLGIDWSAK